MTTVLVWVNAGSKEESLNNPASTMGVNGGSKEESLNNPPSTTGVNQGGKRRE
jgi:hypothetical protein